MKSTGSSRSLTNGSGGHGSHRATMPSPLASSASLSRMSPSGKKTKRGGSTSGSDKPPQHESSHAASYSNVETIPSSPGPEVMYQLPHHQQSLHQAQGFPIAYGYAGATPLQPLAPPGYASFFPAQAVMQRIPSGLVEDPGYRGFQPAAHSPPLSSPSDTAEDLMERIDKKDQMITQLGSFLSQMKQDSEGTAQAWKEKLHEIAELRRQVTTLTQQLRESQDKEKATSEQLAQVTDDVELAVQGLKENEAKHLEEVKILHDELQRREHDYSQDKQVLEERTNELLNQLTTAQRTAEELSSRCASMETSLRQADDGNKMAMQQLEEQVQQEHLRLEEAQSHIQTMENEKQELAQHLWNVTQALEQSSSSERTVHAKLEEVKRELEQEKASAADRGQRSQTERAELLEIQSKLQNAVHALEAAVAEERSQKQEINTVMGEEMQRVTSEMQTLRMEAASAKKTLEEDRIQWRQEMDALLDKLHTTEEQYAAARQELDVWQQRASQIDAEFQALQRNGSETNSTLQELTDQLRMVLGQLHTSQIQSDELRQHCNALDSGIQKCIQALPASSTKDEDGGSSPPSSFPESVLAALEKNRQQQSTLEQLQLSHLQLQQDRDSERDRFRVREQELLQSTLVLKADADAVRADAAALAEEVQALTQRLGGSEAKLLTQVQQLTKDLEDARTNAAMQLLQIQKTAETARQRVQQLENEKKDLLHEAESLNASMQSLYAAKKDKQVELDQLRSMYSTLQLEHSDLQERMEDAEGTYQQTLDQLNTKATELQTNVQQLSSTNERLEKENAVALEALAKLRAEHDTLDKQFAAEQLTWAEVERTNQRVVEEKTQRMEEMMSMLTQLRSRNESLEQTRAVEDQHARAELDKCQFQLVALNQEKKKLEATFSQAKLQLDSLLPELFTLKEKDRQAGQTQGELEDELRIARGEVARLQAECERLSRARSALQGELNRASDDAQDAMRQCEVLRRDGKLQHAQLVDEVEQLRREADELRSESGEAAVLVEELQNKLTSVQSAANATINELMQELQSAQDTHALEKSRLQKEVEVWKSQASTAEEELRRKEADVKELNARCQQERSLRSEQENEWSVKLSRLSSALESKKFEGERLSKELETKSLRLAECERRLAPLANTRDQLQAKCHELRQALDAKTREASEVESKGREDVARAVREKRELETMYTAIKEDYETLKIQSSSAQQQWQSVERTLRQGLERTKAELVKVTAEARALAQRMETGQAQAHENVAELAERLQGVEQQKEAAVLALQRDVNLERERRREAEVQKMELQRLLKQRGAGGERTIRDGGGGGGGESSGGPDHQSFQSTGIGANQLSPPTLTQTQSPTPTESPPEYRKFYANEPMTNAELANLPMTLIKAQIGLDLSASKSPAKASASKSVPRASSLKHAGNNDEIPLLAFDRLPQNPEAVEEEEESASPSCDSSASLSTRRLASEKRSGAVSLLEALSSRSSSDRYLAEMMDGVSIKPPRNSSSSSLGSNNKKKPPPTKKKRPSVMPSSSSTAAAAYAASAFSSLSPSPPKMKSNSKLLPRIQQ